MRSGRRRRVGRRLLLGALGLVLVLGGGGIAAYSLTSYGAGEPHRGSLALRGGTVLVGPELRPVAQATVLINDGVIAAVGPDAEIAVPAGAEVLDLDGRTVLPGLIDLHVHLGSTEREAGEPMRWWHWPA